MANPTTAAPTVAELDSGHALAANLRFFCAMTTAHTMPRDIVGNVMCEDYGGSGFSQTGPIPAKVNNGFLSVDAPHLLVKGGDAGLMFPGRGWTNVAAPRTIFGTFSCDVCADDSNAQNYFLEGNGSDVQTYGACIRTAINGTITFSLFRNQAYLDSDITLTKGHKYAYFITIVGTDLTGSNANRLFQVYDYDTQTLSSLSTKADTFAYSTWGSGSTSANNANAVMNTGLGGNTWGGSGGEQLWYGKLGPWGLYSGTFDPGSNSLFQSFYQDPWGVGRGSYTQSGALTAASVSAMSTESGILLEAARSTGGTGNVSGQWYRDTTSGFVAGPGNVLAGATHAGTDGRSSFLDTTAVYGTVYFYKYKWTDSAGSPASVTSVQVSGSKVRERRIGAMTDSLFGSNGRIGRAFTRAMLARGIRIGLTNRGKGGSASKNTGTPANSWQPSANQVGTTIFDNALTCFNAAGVDDVIVALGTNDPSTSAATFQTQMANIVNALVAAGKRVFLIAPPYAPSYTESQIDLLRQYQTALANLANGTTIFYVTADNWRLTAASKRFTHADLLHYQASDMVDAAMGDLYANAIVDAVLSTMTAATPSITAIGSDSVSVAWTAPTNAGSRSVKYQLQYGPMDEGEILWDSWFETFVTDLSATVTGLTTGQTYYFRVVARDEANGSVTVNSATLTATTASGGGGRRVPIGGNASFF